MCRYVDASGLAKLGKLEDKEMRMSIRVLEHVYICMHRNDTACV